jgi:hypothetical protein
MTKPRSWSWLLLFTTSGTLLCCALPITLVTLGLGASVATMASAAPWLITLSQYKCTVPAAPAPQILNWQQPVPRQIVGINAFYGCQPLCGVSVLSPPMPCRFCRNRLV